MRRAYCSRSRTSPSALLSIFHRKTLAPITGPVVSGLSSAIRGPRLSSIGPCEPPVLKARPQKPHSRNVVMLGEVKGSVTRSGAIGSSINHSGNRQSAALIYCRCA